MTKENMSIKFKAREIIMAFIFFTVIITGCTQNQKEDDWDELFVENIDNWTTIGDALWKSDKDQLTGLAGDGLGFAVTQEEYRNFHLKLEFFPDAEVNSGVFFRCPKDSISPLVCYEANIWDEHVNQDFRTGAIVRQASPPLTQVNTLNQWNTYEIMANDNHIQVWVNDQKTIDFKSDLAAEGIIALQFFKEGSIKFRKVRIKRLQE